MARRPSHLVAALTLAIPALLHAQAPANKPTPVTVENFARAESHRFFSHVVQGGGFGKFRHNREAPSIDKQGIVRGNRDTLYSSAVFDLDAEPVTITLPDAGERFMSLQVFSEDHYTQPVVYGGGAYTFTKEQIGTRYMMVGIRTLYDPKRPEDIQKVHALQDAIQSRQAQSGQFEIPRWDPVSQKKVRDALMVLGETVPDLNSTFGTRDQVSPVRHLIGSATAWGGNPQKDATYFSVTPNKNDGATVHRLHVEQVPVDAFWSVSVYNAAGYFEKNPYGAYAINNLSAAKDADGSVTIQFGGCNGKQPNCLPVMPGWNYLVRLYRPRAEVLNGSWTFPEAQPVTSPM